MGIHNKKKQIKKMWHKTYQSPQPTPVALLSPSCRPPVPLLPLRPGSVQFSSVRARFVELTYQESWWAPLRKSTWLAQLLVCCVALAASVPWVSALSSSEAWGEDKQEDPFNYTLGIYAHPCFSSGTGAEQSIIAGWRSRASCIYINLSVYMVRIL